MKYLLTLTMCLITLNCFAAIYIKTDNQGNVIYSDTPEDHATPLKLPQTNNSISIPQNTSSNPASTHTAPLPSPTATASPLETGHKNYSAFAITIPSDQQTFQNQRDIPVTVTIDPPLQEGDKVQLYVDGAPAGDPSADLTQLAIHQVDRGKHQLSAALLDQDGHVLNTAADIAIYIHYSAIPTGSGAIPAIPSGGQAPSSPGSGITPPAQEGSGTTPPSQNGSGTTPPTQKGSGTTPPSQPGSGIVPPFSSGAGIVPGRP